MSDSTPLTDEFGRGYLLGNRDGLEAGRAEAATPAASGDALREALEPFERKWLAEVRAWTYKEVRDLLDAALAASPPLPEGLDRDGWAEVVHDALWHAGWADGGAKDVCNRYEEHLVVADAILARLQQPDSGEGAGG
jgi:hypothetical protein